MLDLPSKKSRIGYQIINSDMTRVAVYAFFGIILKVLVSTRNQTKAASRSYLEAA